MYCCEMNRKLALNDYEKQYNREADLEAAKFLEELIASTRLIKQLKWAWKEEDYTL